MTEPVHSLPDSAPPPSPAGPPGQADSLATRRSLLTRLKDLEDHAGWREFFDRYWRLIYNVARKSGLSDADAQDIVQETMHSVASMEGGLRNDPGRGRFRSLLLTIVQRRIVDFWRKRSRQAAPGTSPVPAAEIAGPDDGLETLWDEEWKNSLLETALSRLQTEIPARQLQIFHLSVVQGVPVAEIRQRLGVTLSQIYMARFRIGRRVRAEVERLRRED